MGKLFQDAVKRAIARVDEDRAVANAKRQAMRELVAQFAAECDGETLGNATITAELAGNDMVMKINGRAKYIWASDDDFCRLYSCEAPSVDLAAADTLQEMADLVAAILVETEKHIL